MAFVSNVEMNESELNVVSNVEKSIAHGMLAPAFQAYPAALKCTFATFNSVATVQFIYGLATLVGTWSIVGHQPVEKSTT